MPARIAHASIRPQSSLNLLSAREISGLLDSANRDVYSLFRQCALAVLNTGGELDGAGRISFADFGGNQDLARQAQPARGLDGFD